MYVPLHPYPFPRSPLTHPPFLSILPHLLSPHPHLPKSYAASGMSPLGMAAIWGTTVAMAVYSTRDISGAHLNPAVTAHLAINADFPVKDMAPYMAAQVRHGVSG